ncbi:hypothetical protein NDN08_001180 [Rhodosorus marinus]|uniref:Phospholipid/glycerol acyltransferase domain-containing protein n=1 Tax=Rhodosorus marinus TaxID=101924 RepID=A0AAV8UU62_9RHOD|nr:hypothetical protein NDN08_001180 [Rhodosorus marinus]
MGVASKLKDGFLSAFCLFLIGGAGFVVNVGQLLALVILPFDRHLFRSISTWLGSGFMIAGPFLLEDWGGCKFSAYGEQAPPDSKVLIVVNHGTDMDWAGGLSYLARLGEPFPGGAKAIAKDTLMYIPIFGWLTYFLEFMYVKRDWESDKKTLTKQANQLGTSRLPFYLCLFPEGTRKTPKKHAQSQEFCKKNGYPVLNNLLYPRFKAFTLIAMTMRDQIDGVIDATFAFEGEHPNMSKSLSRKLSCRCNLICQYHPMNELPEGEEELEEWLRNTWVKKDALLDEVLKDQEAFCSKQRKYEWKQEPLDYTKFFALVGVFCFFLVGLSVLMIVNKIIRRGVLVISVITWVAVVAALVINIRPSKVGEKKPDPETSSRRKKAD